MEVGVVGVVVVEIGNPWVLDYEFGWRQRWRWLDLVVEGGFFWVSMGVGCGCGDRCGHGEGKVTTADHAAGCGS